MVIMVQRKLESGKTQTSKINLIGVFVSHVLAVRNDGDRLCCRSRKVNNLFVTAVLYYIRCTYLVATMKYFAKL